MGKTSQCPQVRYSDGMVGPIQPKTQGWTPKGQAGNGPQRAVTTKAVTNCLVSGIRCQSHNKGWGWWILFVYLLYIGSAAFGGPQADCGVQPSSCRYHQRSTTRSRSHGDQGAAEEDQCAEATPTAHPEERKPNQNQGATNGEVHGTNEGSCDKGKTKTQRRVGRIEEGDRPSQDRHPKNQERCQPRDWQSGGVGTGRTFGYQYHRKGDGKSQKEIGQGGTREVASYHDDVQYATETGPVYGAVCACGGHYATTSSCTNGRGDADLRRCPVCGDVQSSVSAATSGEVTFTIALRSQQGQVQGSGWHGLSCLQEMRPMDTSISSRASTKQVQNVEHYNFEQGTGTHEFGVVMLPNVSDVPMRYHKPEVVVDPRRLHHASDNFCYATRTLSSEDCYVQGATLQDIKNDTMKHQLGQLMLISVLFGSMLLCQWMTKELQRGTIIGDACLRERNAIQRSRTLGPDMGERRQVSGVIGWRTLRYIYYVLLFSASMLTATASEDDNVLQQLHQRRLAQVQQPQVPTPTPLDHRWANFEETYRLPRPDPGSYYDAAIARPDVILQHRGTSLSLRLHYAAEPHRYQTLIEGHWQDIFIDVSPNNEWRVHSMNEAAYGSSFFPAAYRHFILTTDWERHTCSGHRAIAVEVIWRTPNGESTVLMRPWIPTTTTTVGFLQALGLLHGCMTSHRCHATINGQTCVTRWVQFTHGTYVKVDAYPMQIPEDTESEGEEPAPIAGATFEDDATTTSRESSSNSIDPLYLDDAFITDTIVVHRPPGRVPRPLRLIQTVEHTDPNNLLVIMQHWNDLRYHPMEPCRGTSNI